jgi:hypothetical protein
VKSLSGAYVRFKLFLKTCPDQRSRIGRGWTKPLGSHGGAGGVQGHRERPGTALIYFLREEQHVTQFHARRQSCATFAAQGLRLRQADTARQKGKQKNKARG